MAKHKTQTALAFGAICLALASCAVSGDPLTDEDVGALESGLPKPRGTNGARDYCNNRAAPCDAAEGDCDASSQCTAGNVCVANVGPQLGMPEAWDVCLPAHCNNGVLDADETFVDCGGSCSAAGYDCTTFCRDDTLGSAEHCSVRCRCESGQGDCDSSLECATGLVCGRGNGPQFGMPFGYDACAPPHCSNGRRDSDETQIDCGGSCGTLCPSVQCDLTPSRDRCTEDCVCGYGEGDCDATRQCEPGLLCIQNNGPSFGFPSDWDVCGPSHCTNDQRDADQGELGVDCGGDCTPCPSVGSPCRDACAPGARCFQGMCLEALGIFEFCDDCVAYRFEGELCVCGEGLDCWPGVSDGCRELEADEGQRCGYRPCLPGLYCQPRVDVCAKAGGLDEPCPDRGECDPGLRCIDGRCRAG